MLLVGLAASAAIAVDCFMQGTPLVCYEDPGTNPGPTFQTTRLCPNPAGTNLPPVIRTVTVKVLGEWTKPAVRQAQTGETGTTTKQVNGVCSGWGQMQDCAIPPGWSEPPSNQSNPNDPGEGPCTGAGCTACNTGG